MELDDTSHIVTENRTNLISTKSCLAPPNSFPDSSRGTQASSRHLDDGSRGAYSFLSLKRTEPRPVFHSASGKVVVQDFRHFFPGAFLFAALFFRSS
jgi:hypothetical protein